MRYTPPTPRWAGVAFIFMGLVLATVGGLGVIIQLATGNVANLPGIACEGFLGFLGILAIVKGIQSLMTPGQV